MQLLKDDLSRDITPDSWLVSAFGNQGAYFRYYYINGYADDGRLMVHEYKDQRGYGSKPKDVPELTKVKLPQTIIRPRHCLIYPYDMLEGIIK